MFSINRRDRILTVEIRNATTRAALSILLLALITPALYLGYRICRAEYPVRTKGDLRSYARAIRLDPANGEYWWMRGRFHHYDLEFMNLPAAISDYEHALQLNPKLVKAWLDLAEAYEKAGSEDKADQAMRTALLLHPYSPSAQWQAGNFYLLRGDLARMYACFKTACEYDIGKLRPALELAWKTDADRGGILKKLVPENLPAYLTCLNFLVEHNEPDLAGIAWKGILLLPVQAAFQFKTSYAFGLIDGLLSRGRTREAFLTWKQALKKSVPARVDTRFPADEKFPLAGANLLWNGSFEDEILNGGFDWRYFSVPEVELQPDTSERTDGSGSLRITFAPANIQFAGLRQILPDLPAGMYRLEYYAKTGGLTSDQLPYIVVRTLSPDSETCLQMEMLPADSEWRKYSDEFKIETGPKSLQIMLLRDLSTKLGNRIQGSLWLDQFSLVSESAAGDGTHP